MADLVGVIESAYRLDLDDEAWLHGVVTSAGPHFDCGHGVYGFRFDASRPHAFRLWGMVAQEGAMIVPELVESWHELLLPEQVFHVYRASTQFAPISERLARAGVDSKEVAEGFCHKIGVVDQLTLRGTDSTGQGITVCTPLVGATAPRRRAEGLWTRIAAHLAAGYRLRRRLGDDAHTLDEDAAAVCEPDGRVVEARGDAREETARSALRDAVVAIDRARSRLRREHPIDAIEVWRGLVEGRWSLVEHFDSDGRRYLVARENAPGSLDPKALTPRESEVTEYAVLGHSTKETAYALGISTTTVSGHLSAAMKKLGAKTRVELVQLMWRATQAD